MTYFEKHRGDETPFARVSAHDTFTTDAATLGDASGDGGAPGAENAQGALVTTEPKVGSVVGLQTDIVSANLKVYQVDLEIGLLFLLNGSELLVTFKLLTNLTRVNRCTGRNYASLHGRQCNVLPERSRFLRVQRLHTSDGDLAQDLAERALAARMKSDPQYQVPTLRSLCQIHRVYHVMTIAFAISSAFLTGCIRLALSLRGPGHFLQFKQLLWSWLLGHCSYLREEVPRGAGFAADTHRQRIWDIFFPRTSSRKQRRNRLKYWIVRRLPNGEIRLHDTFQHYCKEGCCANRRDFLRKLKWFVAIVAGQICTVINRGRWTKADDGIDWIGIFANVHNLLPTIYTLWYEKVTGRKLPRVEAATPAAVAHHAALMDVAAPVGFGVGPDGDGAEEPAPVLGEPNAPAANATPTTSQTPEDHQRNRSSGLKLALSPTLRSDCIAIKSLAQPVFNMMHASLEQGGAKWERLQYARAASVGAREYRSTNAAMMKLERAAMTDLYNVSSDSSRWEVIQLDNRTVGFRNTCFKLSSSLGCGIAAKHTRVHSKFPTQAFTWLGSAHGLQSEYDRHLCKKVLGPWFEAFCDFWMKHGGLDSRGCQADLAATSVLLQEDMGEIEANHASIRRELMLLSTQTNACDFMDLSDRFVLRCCRRQPESYGVRPVKATGMFKAPQRANSDHRARCKSSTEAAYGGVQTLLVGCSKWIAFWLCRRSVD